jgi:hypothetical protein
MFLSSLTRKKEWRKKFLCSELVEERKEVPVDIVVVHQVHQEPGGADLVDEVPGLVLLLKQRAPHVPKRKGLLLPHLKAGHVDDGGLDNLGAAKKMCRQRAGLNGGGGAKEFAG